MPAVCLLEARLEASDLGFLVREAHPRGGGLVGGGQVGVLKRRPALWGLLLCGVGHIGFYDVARSQNSVAGLSQKPPRSRFLPQPQAFLAHFARFVPILCAVKQIQEAQSANRNHILLL